MESSATAPNPSVATSEFIDNIDPAAAAHRSNLSPPPHAGTLDLDPSNDPLESSHERTPHRRRYAGDYVIVLLQRYWYGFSVLLLTAAIAMGAVGLRDGQEALALATANAAALAGGEAGAVQETRLDALRVGIAPPPAPAPRTTTPPIAPPAAKPTVEPTADERHFTFESLQPTEAPTPKPTKGPTEAPTEPHPLDPQWYQTSHADYQKFLDMIDAQPAVGELGHDWFGANQLCSRQERFLCDYDVYCPAGRGGAPFGGGPPRLYNADALEETQWVPYFTPADKPGGSFGKQGSHWAQIGRLDEEDGGSEENDFLLCWKYDEWYAGNGVDIVDVWAGEHRVWILCCNRAED